MQNITVTTNAQKVLDFLMQFPEKEYLEKEIQKSTDISKAGVNLAIKDLYRLGLIKKITRGKISFYRIDSSIPFVKQLKTVRTVYILSPLIKKLSKISRKIVLYGSCSRGEDTSDSDIDLFVATNQPGTVKKEIQQNRFARKVQLTVRTPLKFIEMEKTDPVFSSEINRGIVLWESKDEH